MFITGNNENNPVLLFIHGGPGMPEYPLTEKYPISMDEHFTVCWWEQRGAGISYRKKMNYHDIAIEQLVLDTIAVTHYLKQRFNKNKIFLMGHSFGSFIGLKAVKKSPELYHAYIGMAQITHQLESEKIAYQYMTEQYRKINHKRMLKRMAKHDISALDNIPITYYQFRDKPMHELGIGTMHNMKSVISGIFLPVMSFSGYSFLQRIKFWKAKSLLLKKTHLWKDVIDTDLSLEITKVETPVYFLHGIYDFTVNYSLTRDYFKTLQAPVKGFYTFDKSAHSPLFEETEKFIQICTGDVLSGKTELSDEMI